MQKFLKIFCLCLLNCVIINSSFAADTACILLGPKPSFIIKLPNQLSSTITRSTLSAASLADLSAAANLTFTVSRAMAGGNYIVEFQPMAQYRNCYPQNFINQIITRLKKSTQAINIEPNFLLNLDSVPPSLLDIVPTPSAQQWNLSANTAAGGINAPEAWAITSGSSNAVVAVLDAGILTNTSLAPNLLLDHAASFYNAGTVTTGANSQCPTCSQAAHGTHVSGSVVASGNGNYGANVYGVAYTGRVLPINVFTKFTDSSICSPASTPCLLAYLSDIDNALMWVASTATFSALGTAPNTVAVSMSFGSQTACPSTTQTAINALYTENITTVAAAGNSSVPNNNANNYEPANCTHVIVVAATGPTNKKAYYSNYGSIVDIAAPGGDTDFGATSLIYSTIKDGYGYLQGTSMATPQVSGLVSLLYSVDPTMTPDRALTLLQSNVTAFADGGVYPGNICNTEQYCGAGIINAGAAVTAANAAKPSLEWTPDFHTNQISDTSVVLTWNAATWSNAASTPVLYTVKLNGVEYTDCTNISATTCTITDVQQNVGSSEDIPFTVEATDGRDIYTPDSQAGTINLILTAPSLTTAERNTTDTTEAYVDYSDAGSVSAFTSYRVNGLSGVTVTLDSSNNHFVLNNVVSTAQTNISITGITADTSEATSNTITLPGIAAVAPTLTVAKRNPMLSSEAWVYYSNAGSFDNDNIFSVAELAGSNTRLDLTNQRFVIDNITTGRAMPIHITVTNPYNNSATSNQITLPGILTS